MKDNKCSFIFDFDDFIVKIQDNQLLVRGSRRENLYALEENNEAALSAIRGKAADSTNGTKSWHEGAGTKA